ncbi:MAG: ABC transporter ATP-binding protein [Oscillospiraceae bacterium]|nr:ABC transporter ATP-binding protein [Oscillospiraceae bacterium]
MDKTASRSRTRRTLRLLLRGSGWYFFICILSGTLLTVCDLVIPQVIRVTVDSVIGNAPPALGGGALRILDLMGGVEGLRAHMWRIAVFLGVLGLLGAMFRYLSGVTNAMAGETLVKTARDALYHHIQRLPWAWHSRNPTGDIIQRCTSDVERVKTFFQEQFVITFRLVVTILLALACMLTMNAKLSLVALLMLPIVIAYSLHFYNRIRDEFTECDENEGILSTIAQENLTGVRVVKAFGRENFERERFEKQNVYYTGLWVGLLRDMSVFWSVGDLTSCLQIMLVVVFGTVLCVRGEMTGGEFISFAVYNAMLIGPVRRLGRLISEMSKMGVSLNRLGEVLSAEPEQDVPDALTAPMDRDIRFENVSFRYSEDQPEVLHGVSFTIPAGKSFGILGGTGSGKSTLLALLCRLYAPTEGEILVGDTPLARMRAKWVRENVGVVLQEPFLFSRSVEENIGVCGADAEAVRAAAVTACIDADISRFANGYETVVGERGVTLSGGQKQRIAIARMLTKKTPVIVFDDSLSAVDTETDERIRSALKRDLEGTTTIIVSHRITTLLDCDSVLVLEKGQVSQLGSPKDLLAREGIFRRIFELQMAVGEED